MRLRTLLAARSALICEIADLRKDLDTRLESGWGSETLWLVGFGLGKRGNAVLDIDEAIERGDWA